MSERMISRPIAGAAPGGGEIIVNGDEKTFMQDVVQASRQIPIMVLFWATWSDPCKQLTPTLERAVRAAAGRVKLVEIDIDENRALIQQLTELGMPLESVPAVAAFWKGLLADIFQGALPEAEVKRFIEALLTVAGGTPPASPAEWQEYVLALRSYVRRVQRVIEDQQQLYAYVGMVRRLVNGEQRLFGSSPDDQLDMDDLKALLSSSSIGPPHGLDLLIPITKPLYEFPTLPPRPPGTCPDQIDLQDGSGEEVERQVRVLSMRLDDRIARTNEQLTGLRIGIAANDPEAIRRLMSVSHVRHSLPACLAQAFDVDIDFSARVALCTVEIPDFANFQVVKRRNAAASAAEGRRVLETMLYSLCLRAAHLVASSDVGDWFDTVAVNAWQSWRDRATGAPCEGIIASLQSDKNEIMHLHLDQVDPKACFRHLKGISTPSLEQVAPVRPIFVLNKADSRIIEDKSVAEHMEPEANLAAMPWEDFEHLVRQLFEWEFGQHGVEVRVHTSVPRSWGRCDHVRP